MKEVELKTSLGGPVQGPKGSRDHGSLIKHFDSPLLDDFLWMWGRHSIPRLKMIQIDAWGWEMAWCTVKIWEPVWSPRTYINGPWHACGKLSWFTTDVGRHSLLWALPFPRHSYMSLCMPLPFPRHGVLNNTLEGKTGCKQANMDVLLIFFYLLLASIW